MCRVCVFFYVCCVPLLKKEGSLRVSPSAVVVALVGMLIQDHMYNTCLGFRLLDTFQKVIWKKLANGGLIVI